MKENLLDEVFSGVDARNLRVRKIVAKSSNCQ